MRVLLESTCFNWINDTEIFFFFYFLLIGIWRGKSGDIWFTSWLQGTRESIYFKKNVVVHSRREFLMKHLFDKSFERAIMLVINSSSLKFFKTFVRRDRLKFIGEGKKEKKRGEGKNFIQDFLECVLKKVCEIKKSFAHLLFVINCSSRSIKFLIKIFTSPEICI